MRTRPNFVGYLRDSMYWAHLSAQLLEGVILSAGDVQPTDGFFFTRDLDLVVVNVGEDDLDTIPEQEAHVAAEFNNAGDRNAGGMVEVIGMCVQLEAEAAGRDPLEILLEPPRATVAVGEGTPTRGKSGAPVVLVEEKDQPQSFLDLLVAELASSEGGPVVLDHQPRVVDHRVLSGGRLRPAEEPEDDEMPVAPVVGVQLGRLRAGRGVPRRS